MNICTQGLNYNAYKWEQKVRNRDWWCGSFFGVVLYVHFTGLIDICTGVVVDWCLFSLHSSVGITEGRESQILRISWTSKFNASGYGMPISV